MNTCSICRRSEKDCIKEDEKLLKPFNPNIVDDRYRPSSYATRLHKAYKYSLGLYDPEKELFYSSNLSAHCIYAAYIKLPLCVYEREDWYLLYAIQKLTSLNLEKLPLPESTKRKLHIWFGRQIHLFVYGY